jgi:predicted RNase H-like HicB family nuclease
MSFEGALQFWSHTAEFGIQTYSLCSVRFSFPRHNGFVTRAGQSEIIIYWSQVDDTFIAEVPELPGCAADGKTHKEALANVEVITQEWIETAKELGRPIPAHRVDDRFTPEESQQRIALDSSRCKASRKPQEGQPLWPCAIPQHYRDARKYGWLPSCRNRFAYDGT